MSLTFSLFWVDAAFPTVVPSAIAARDPGSEARATFQRIDQAHGGWEASSRLSGENLLVEYVGPEERRRLATWTTTYPTEDGRLFRGASLHLQRQSIE